MIGFLEHPSHFTSLQLSTSQVELLKLLSNPSVREIPVLLVLNKNKSPLVLDLSQIYNIFNIDGILKHALPVVKVSLT